MRETRIVFEVTKDGFLTAQRELEESRRGSFLSILAGILIKIRRRLK